MDETQSDLEAIRQILADLTTRIARIEQHLQIPIRPEPQSKPAQSQPIVAPITEPQAANVPPVEQPPIAPPPLFASHSKTPSPSRRSQISVPQALTDANLETRIASQWFNRIGITAMLIGVSYFLKLAFDNNWIGPTGRVTIGFLVGIAVLVWSERFRSRGYPTFSYSLKAVGIGTLYLSLWAAFQVYNLIPSGVAFAMMFAVTAATGVMAVAQNAQILAAYAIAGGFSTPALLSTGQNREIALFAYVAILDFAALALVAFKPWRRLLTMSYAGTILLYLAWYLRFYGRAQFGITLAFATLFFVIFAAAPLVTAHLENENPLFAFIPPIIALVNAGVYFLQAYVMIEEIDKTYMAWFALALAAIYILLSRRIHSRNQETSKSEILYFLHLAIAIGFITIAIPIRLDAHWITIGWFVEAGVLLFVGSRVKSDFLNVLALIALILGVGRLLFIDNFSTTQLFFNVRIATYAVAVAVLGAVAWFASKRDDEAARSVAAVAVVALNALALIALSREVADYYARLLAVRWPSRQMPSGLQYFSTYDELRHIYAERDFTYSALWMAYGAMLMFIGFLRRSAFVRWQALILLGLAIAKVFIHDVFELDLVYRVVSFIVLGILLLGISFAYQRDWLQLSNREQAPDDEGSASL
jgi:uncharacterized membrane protein